MKIFKFLLPLMAFYLLVSCGDNEEPAPTPPAAEKPAITLIQGEVETHSLSFTLESEHAEEVAWLCIEKGEALPDANTILTTGDAVAHNKQVTVTIEELTPATTYMVVAAAAGGGMEVRSNILEMTTVALQPEPTVELEAVATAETTLTFRLTTTNAEEVKWIAIVKGSRDLKPEQVLQYGTEAEANSSLEITIEELTDNTEYQIFGVAKAGELLVCSDPLEMKTDEIPFVPTLYTVNADSAECSILGETNYFITFEDTLNKYLFKADLYVAEGNTYLPSGEYALGEVGQAGSASKAYTQFQDVDTMTEGARFSEGMLKVEAAVDEEHRLVKYRITGNFTLEDGNLVEISYTGLIDGIELPSTDVPEGYHNFEVSNEVSKPKRLNLNGEVLGEYTLRFYDKNGGELTLDILADPILCNDGNDHLPAGTYSIADGTMTDYTNIALYYPYWAASLHRCTVEVSFEEGVYTIVVDAEGTSGSDTRKIWMKYEGEIQDMTR